VACTTLKSRALCFRPSASVSNGKSMHSGTEALGRCLYPAYFLNVS